MMEWISKMLDRITAVIVAIILMQFPLFMEQYSMRLSGHVDEITYQVQQIADTAKSSGKTIEQYIEKFVSSKDSDFSKQGTLMRGMVDRKERLTNSLTAIADANVITRPFIFLFRSDWGIVHATADDYQIGLAISLESAVYAVVGVFLGYYIYQVLSAFFLRVGAGLKRAKKRESSVTHQS